MVELRQLSILDHQELIGEAFFGIKKTPKQVASRFGIKLEKSFDDLGYYHFLCLEYDTSILGFFRHIDSDKDYSYVSIKSSDKNDAKKIISLVCDIPQNEVIEFDEKW